MDTLEKTTEKPQRTIERVSRNNRWLILAVVVLFAALVALGAWLLIDNLVTSDVEALIDDYLAAWETNDYDALAAVVTDDFVFTDDDGIEYRGEADLKGELAGYFLFEFEVVSTGPISVSGDWVSQPQRISFTTGVWEGFSLYEIEGDLIKRHFIAAMSPVP
jgi:hypothetical protein